MVVHLKVKFEYHGQSHFCKLILTVGQQILLLKPTFDINIIIKVIWRLSSFQHQIVSVNFYPEAGRGPSTECILVYFNAWVNVYLLGWFLFHDTEMTDTIVGLLLLAVSLFILCTGLVMMVKLLHSILRGQIAKVNHANLHFISLFI